MKRPKIEDFKTEFTKGVTEIASARKQYSKAQDLHIDKLERLLKNAKDGLVLCSLIDKSAMSKDLINEIETFLEVK